MSGMTGFEFRWGKLSYCVDDGAESFADNMQSIPPHFCSLVLPEEAFLLLFF
jgi:hypothetical protein